MSQNTSSEQFFSCTEDEPSAGSGLGLRFSNHKHANVSKSDKTSFSFSSPPSSPSAGISPAPHQEEKDMNSRIAHLPSSDEATSADEKATTPLIRRSSRVPKVQTSRWRHLMLIIFSLNMAVSAGVLSTFIPSNAALECFYSSYNSGWMPWAKHLAVFDTVVKALLLLPSAWMLVRYELKFTVVFASCATALGTALRLIGASKELFAVLVTGQLVSSFSSLMLVSVTFFSEVWFSPTERVIATAFSAVIGPKLGVIASHVLGPLVLLDSDKNCAGDVCWCEVDTMNWQYYLMGQGVLSLILLIVTVTVFRMAPPNPPSLSRRLEISARSAEVTFCEQLKAYLTSFLEFGRNCFFLFLIPAGIVVGASGSLVPLLDQIVMNTTQVSKTSLLPTAQHIAYLEVTASVSSIIAAFLIAVLLDWTKLFYYLSLVTYVGVLLSVTAFATIVYHSLHSDVHYLAFYFAVGLVGASVSAFQVLGLEYSVEMTFPVPEGTSAAVFYFTGMLLSLIMRVSMNEAHADKVYIVVWVITALTILGLLPLIFVKPELKRKTIEQKKKLVHCPTPCLL